MMLFKIFFATIKWYFPEYRIESYVLCKLKSLKKKVDSFLKVIRIISVTYHSDTPSILAFDPQVEYLTYSSCRNWSSVRQDKNNDGK
jgi:hypothetical protein